MSDLAEGLSSPAQWPQGLAPPTGRTIPSRLLALACLRCERGGLRRPGAAQSGIMQALVNRLGLSCLSTQAFEIKKDQGCQERYQENSTA